MNELQDLVVVLKDCQTETNVQGGELTVDEGPTPWILPCTVCLPAGRHKLEVSHPTRIIRQPNPRIVEVLIQTDPNEPAQMERFEAEPASQTRIV